MSIDELEQAYKLKKKGVISEEEFETKKKQILSQKDTPKNTNKKAVIILLSVVIVVLCAFALYYVLDNISPKLYTEQQIKCSNDICYNDKQKVINGKVVTYYPNQQIKTLKEYRDGKFLGIETGYYETGEIEYVLETNNTLSNKKIYYKNGNLKSDLSFKNQHPINEIEYYENKNIKFKRKKEDNIVYEEGYSEDGKIQFQRKMDGNTPLDLKSFYDNGFIEEHIITNIADGKITIPVDLSQKEIKTTATLSVESGTINTFYYDRDGKLTKICVLNLYTSQKRCYPFNK